MDALPQQRPRARDDERADGERGDRVGTLEAGGRDQDAADDDGDRGEQVGHRLQERAAHVQTVLRGASQQPHADRAAGGGDEAQRDRGRAVVPCGRREQPPDRLERDVPADAEQDQRVDDGGEDLEPLVAEGAAGRRRPLRHRHREQRERDPADVREQMPRVRQQRERPRPQRPGHLDGEHDEPDAQDEREPPSMAACGGDAVVVRVCAHPPIVPGVLGGTETASRGAGRGRPRRCESPGGGRVGRPTPSPRAFVGEQRFARGAGGVQKKRNQV